ncbi:phosphoglycolate phosphatase [Aidingimonas lacisalsi]|uniref:phosphoglycolate phosphatase n=1 Tax=Aidingimonas lacisalsi TaxID=2604086 RepID=UPI0011D2C213|nr:phosphoglycolate phosphatase [Aidingimonas lacisalsi]
MHPIMQDIQLVAFDLDGTLIDSVPDLAVAVDAALAWLELPPCGEIGVRHWVGNGSRKLLERALHDALGRQPDEAMLERAHDAFLCHYAEAPVKHTRLYPGVQEALDGLSRQAIKLALVTNKPQAFLQPILAHFNMDRYFEVAIGGDTLARKKPHPDPLWHIAGHCRVSAEHCLMAGDSRHDIDAGRCAGFRTVAVPYGYNHGESVVASDPDAVVESLEELVYC